MLRIHQKDPNDWNMTFCYKDREQLARKVHTACHDYIPRGKSYGMVAESELDVAPKRTCLELKELRGGRALYALCMLNNKVQMIIPEKC